MSEEEDFGPAMSRLDRRQRLFVLAFIDDPSAPKREIAKRVGYSDVKDGARVRAHRLLHSRKILDAITEESAKRAQFGGALGLAGLISIARDRKHREHFRACAQLAAIGGFSPKTEHRVTVEHVDHGRMAEIAARLAAELGLDRMKLIGGNVVEADVKPAAVSRETSGRDADQTPHATDEEPLPWDCGKNVTDNGGR